MKYKDERKGEFRIKYCEDCRRPWEKNWMKKNSFKSKSIRLLCKGFRVKPRIVANWFNVSVTTIYRHLDNNK